MLCDLVSIYINCQLAWEFQFLSGQCLPSHRQNIIKMAIQLPAQEDRLYTYVCIYVLIQVYYTCTPGSKLGWISVEVHKHSHLPLYLSLHSLYLTFQLFMMFLVQRCQLILGRRVEKHHSKMRTLDFHIWHIKGSGTR